MSAVYVHFRVDEERYALPVECVLEVAEIGELATVPGAPGAVLGIRNLRAQVLPVISLAAVLGKDIEPDGPRLLIVERADRRAGLMIDEVTDVGELPEEPQETDGGLATAGVVLAGEPIRVIDLDAVFASVKEGVAA